MRIDDTLATRLWSKVRKGSGCWEWTGGMTPNGYGMIWNGRSNRGVHRVSWEVSRGTIPAGKMVCHKCDNRKCVRPDHLFLGTGSDNMRDCSRKGRIDRGTDRPASKLTPSKVRRIRAMRGQSGTRVARRYGVAHSLIYRI